MLVEARQQTSDVPPSSHLIMSSYNLIVPLRFVDNSTPKFAASRKLKWQWKLKQVDNRLN